MMLQFLTICVLLSVDTLHITIDDAVILALESNPSLKAAETRTANAKLNFHETSLSGVLSPILTYSKEDTLPSSTNFSLDLTLFDVNRLSSSLAAYRNSKAAKTQLTETKNSIILSVKVAYVSLLAAQADVEAKRRSFERAEANLKLIQKKLELGSATKLDLMRAKVQRGQAKLALISSENALSTARAQLAAVLGLDPSTVLVAEDFDFQVDSVTVSLDSLISIAMVQRPKLKAQETTARSQKESFWMSIASFLPRASVSWNWSKYDGEDWSKDGPKKRLSLTFDLVGYPFRVASSRKAALAAQYELKATKIAVAQEVQTKYLDFLSAKDRLELAKATLEQARMAYKLARAQYDAGELSVIELFEAESDLADAEAQLEAAKYDVYKSFLNLKFAVGWSLE